MPSKKCCPKYCPLICIIFFAEFFFVRDQILHNLLYILDVWTYAKYAQSRLIFKGNFRIRKKNMEYWSYPFMDMPASWSYRWNFLVFSCRHGWNVLYPKNLMHNLQAAVMSFIARPRFMCVRNTAKEQPYVIEIVNPIFQGLVTWQPF